MTEPTIPRALRDIASLHAEISDRFRQVASELDGLVLLRDGTTAHCEQQPPPLPESGSQVSDMAGWESSHFPPDSLRGHAEHALVQAGQPLGLDDWADRVRTQGFVHDWNPKNPRQLEASLSALPYQTPVFVRAGRRMYDLAERAN